MKLKLAIPLVAIILLIVACEVPRSGPSQDIAQDVPTPDTSQTAPPTTETQPAAEPELGDTVAASVAPPENTVISGSVLIKLNPQAAIQARSAELGSDQIIVSGVNTLDDIMRQIGATELKPVAELVASAQNQDMETFSAQSAGNDDVTQIYRLNFPTDRDSQEVATLVAQDPSVEFAEPNFVAGIVGQPGKPAAFDPNDPYFNYQWNLDALQMRQAWERATGEGIVVAIIDTGVDFGAPDLANTQRLQGFDFTNNDADPTDDQGHGTHVAGTVAQSTNNGVGVAGVAYNAQILPIKVLNSSGQGGYDGIIQGIIYAVDQGADVINMSLAGSNNSQALLNAVQYAHEQGVVVIAAAGNSSGPVQYPAFYDDYVIAVGSTRFDNGLAAYSNFGSQIDLVAPGGDISVDQNGDGYADGILQQSFKTVGNYTYLFFEGTSMASPHVAGVAALMKQLAPNASPDEIKNAMMQTAQSLGAPEQFGAGIVQASAALDAITGAPPSSPTETPTTIPPTDEPTVVPGEQPTETPTPAPITPTPVPPTSVPPTPVPPTPIPPTPVPPQPPVAGQLLVNGDFETSGGWIFGDTPVPASIESSTARSGSNAARLGIVAGAGQFSYSSIWQKATIPAEAGQVTLQAAIYPISESMSGRDQRILILNDDFRVIKRLYYTSSNSRTWEEVNYDLSDLRGQTIYVYISVFNQGSSPSAMYVDNVGLSWSP